MKVLGQITEILNKDINSKYPFGANIQNKTDSVAGTPVVREIYADVLMNLYKLLELTKIDPNSNEDNNDNGFQLVQAFKRLVSDYDTIKTLLFSSGTFYIDYDFSILGSDFICFAQASSNYQNAQIKGSNNVLTDFVSDGFSAGEIVMLKINTGQVNAYSFMNKSVSDVVYTNFGNPLHYNYSNVMDFKVDGAILKSDLTVLDIEGDIRTKLTDNTLVVNDVFKTQNGYIFSVAKASTPSYLKIFFKQNSGPTVELTQQSQIELMTNENKPLILCDGTYLYLSNGSGPQTDTYIFDKYLINLSTSKLEFTSRQNVDGNFLKTQNTCVKGGYFYQFYNGTFFRYGITDGSRDLIYNLINVNGRIFCMNGAIYLSTGEIARKLI